MSEATYEQVLEYCRKRCLVLMDREFFEYLKRWPADMVQVVRCKDCIYWDKEFCMISGIDRVETDYCSKGQRKEDE